MFSNLSERVICKLAGKYPECTKCKHAVPHSFSKVCTIKCIFSGYSKESNCKVIVDENSLVICKFAGQFPKHCNVCSHAKPHKHNKYCSIPCDNLQSGACISICEASLELKHATEKVSSEQIKDALNDIMDWMNGDDLFNATGLSSARCDEITEIVRKINEE